MEKPGGLWISKKSSKESSWEELAFAEDDAAGSLWPPRSYTCSFCRREFRSAQALGGHMNVHRRDRARLKQPDGQYLFSKSSSSPEYPSHNNSDDTRETSCYTLVFNSNPNRFKSQHSCVIDLSSSSSSPSIPYLSPSRVSSSLPPKQDTSSSSPFVVEPSKNCKKILSSSSRSYPSTFSEQKRRDLYEIPVTEGDKKRKIERGHVPKNGDKAKLNLGNITDLSVSMNLLIHQSFPFTAHGVDKEISRVDIRKRRRMLESSLQPSILISSLSCKSDIITRNEEIKDEGDDHFEDLDLELRLGTDPPKGN